MKMTCPMRRNWRGSTSGSWRREWRGTNITRTGTRRWPGQESVWRPWKVQRIGVETSNMQLLKRAKRGEKPIYKELRAQGMRYTDKDTSTRGYVEGDSTIDICKSDDDDNDSDDQNILDDPIPLVVPHTRCSVSGTRHIGIGRDLEDRIHSCRGKGIDVGAYILGLAGGIRWKTRLGTRQLVLCAR